jgi:transposase-like protein
MSGERIRRRYTQQEKAELVRAYQGCRITQKAWCSEHQISVKTLHQWMEANVQEKVCPQSFAKVSISALTTLKEEENIYEQISLQIGKCKIDVTAATDKKLLSEILEMLVMIC